MLAHGLRNGIGMAQLVGVSKVNFKQFYDYHRMEASYICWARIGWRSVDIADVSLNLDRSCGICRPFPEAGEVLTATSSVCASLMKFDEQLGPRRFSFSTSLPSDI